MCGNKVSDVPRGLSRIYLKVCGVFLCRLLLSCTILLAFVVFLPVLDQKLCNFIALVMKFGQLPLLEKRENFLFGSFKVASPLLGLFSFFQNFPI